MTINVKISLCKITRASKLFQRNYYLPLLKPLSPKDALRRKIITGQNVLGSRIEHYIPTLEPHEERIIRRRRRPKGIPIIKKRVRINQKYRYVTPFFDNDMENHDILKNIIKKKPKGRGQQYIYEVYDKNCVLVVPFRMERAIRDKDVIDVVMAQRSEKIVVKLNTGLKITLPVARYEGNSPLYRGSGWTKEVIEEEHHHGRETYSLAKLFEAKEQGVEEWELEMMRLANKRKKKLKGEESSDWKQMLAGCLEDMDWDKFEEDTRQIVEEKDEAVDEEDIPMEVDSMEKTKNVNEKLKRGGEAVLSQLPTMIEVPEVIKTLDKGELCELQEVTGMRICLNNGKLCFVAGQMVKGDENEVFVPGQTLMKDDGTSEYTPGITVCMDNEPTLIPGLVMGEEDSGAMFLPGDSTITEDGQLQFEKTKDDLPPEERSSTSESETITSSTESSSTPTPSSSPTPSPSPSPPPSPSPSPSPSPPPTPKQRSPSPPPPPPPEPSLPPPPSSSSSSSVTSSTTPTPSPSPSPSRSPSPPPKPKSPSPPPPPPPKPKPRPEKPEEPIVIRRRKIKEPEPVVKEKVKKRPPIEKLVPPPEKRPLKINLREPLPPREDPLKLYEERVRQEAEEEKKRMKERSLARKRNEQAKVDSLRFQIRQKYKNMKFEKPGPYRPVEPIAKSKYLQALEESIINGTFFDNEHTKKILANVRSVTKTRETRYSYQNSMKSHIGMGFAKYNFVDYGSVETPARQCQNIVGELNMRQHDSKPAAKATNLI